MITINCDAYVACVRCIIIIAHIGVLIDLITPHRAGWPLERYLRR